MRLIQHELKRLRIQGLHTSRKENLQWLGRVAGDLASDGIRICVS